jgi:hypothetical protein
MPESRSRNKRDFTPPTSTSKQVAVPKPWIAPAMVVCFLLGLAWIVVFYIAGDGIPVMSTIGNWNILIGMGLFIVGFILSTQWR